MSGRERAFGPRVEQMARIIFDGHAEMTDNPNRWDGDELHDDTRLKYRQIADDVLDRTEWRRFGLVPKSAPTGDPS